MRGRHNIACRRFGRLVEVASALVALGSFASSSGRAQEVPFTIHVETTNSIDLRASSVPPKTDTSASDLNVSIQGTERSQCVPVEERQSAGTATASAKIVQSTSASAYVSLRAHSFAQGGHYRTCAACISSTCIGIHGNDTDGYAKGVSDAVASIHFGNSADVAGEYELILGSQASGDARRTITVQDGAGNPLPLQTDAHRPIMIQGSPGATYYVAMTLTAEASNSGGCCSKTVDGQASVNVELLDPRARSRVVELVRQQQAQTFREFQRDPTQLTFRDAKTGIRSDLTQDEFNRASVQTNDFYSSLGVVSTVQVPTPDGTAVVSFDCVPESSQPALASVPRLNTLPLAPPDPEAPPHPISNQGTTSGNAEPQPVPDPAVQVVTTPQPTCPAQTVPIPRVSTAEALARSPQNMRREAGRSPLLDVNALDTLNGRTPPPPQAEPQHRWAHAALSVPNHGAAARLNVWSPRVITGDMSLSQIWVTGGKEDDGTLQTVEAGWQVHTLWQTPFSTAFAFASVDSYGVGSCYALKCAVFYAPPRKESFVLRTNKIILGRPIGTQSTYNGTQGAIDVKWYRNPQTGDWWLQIDGEWIGFYPKTAFHGGPLSNQAEYIDFGGETAGILPTSEMGSGHYASDGPAHAAFQSQIRYFDLTEQVRTPGLIPIQATADCYTVVVDGPAKPEPNPGKYIFFGGPGTNHFQTPAPDPSTESCRPPS